MSITTLKNGPYVHAIGWTRKQDHSACVATRSTWASLVNPFEFNGVGGYRLKDETPVACPTDIPLPVMRSSGVARARSAAKGTVFAALLGKQLLETVSDRQNYDGNRVGVAVASSSAITPIAWEFETVGLCKGWDKTDTLLLPSSIPSAITTQTSAVFDTHAAAIAFQDGIFGVCAAIEYAHLSFTHQRSDYFLIIGAEEVCQIQCSALAALGDRRPWIDSASGLVLSGSPNSAGDWQLALCGNAVEGAAQVLPEEWADASMIQIDIESSATLFSAPLVSYALHHLFVNATGKAVLSCRLPGRGKYVLGFTQHASC